MKRLRARVEQERPGGPAPPSLRASLGTPRRDAVFADPDVLPRARRRARQRLLDRTRAPVEEREPQRSGRGPVRALVHRVAHPDRRRLGGVAGLEVEALVVALPRSHGWEARGGSHLPGHPPGRLLRHRTGAGDARTAGWPTPPSY